MFIQEKLSLFGSAGENSIFFPPHTVLPLPFQSFPPLLSRGIFCKEPMQFGHLLHYRALLSGYPPSRDTKPKIEEIAFFDDF